MMVDSDKWFGTIVEYSALFFVKNDGLQFSDLLDFIQYNNNIQIILNHFITLLN